MSNAVLPYTANAIVNNRLKGDGTEPKYIAVGTGVGTMTRDKTSLFSEKSGGSPTYARIAGASTISTTTQTDDTYSVSGTFEANASEDIRECGLFDDPDVAQGNAFMLVDFSPIPVTPTQALAFVFRVIGK